MKDVNWGVVLEAARSRTLMLAIVYKIKNSHTLTDKSKVRASENAYP